MKNTPASDNLQLVLQLLVTDLVIRSQLTSQHEAQVRPAAPPHSDCHCTMLKYMFFTCCMCSMQECHLSPVRHPTTCLPSLPQRLRLLCGVQQILEALNTDPQLREMLQPPHTRRRAGAWVLGIELLLSKLPPKDMAAAIQAV